MLAWRHLNTAFSSLFCSLRHNVLGEETGVALGKALETNTSLQELRFVP